MREKARALHLAGGLIPGASKEIKSTFPRPGHGLYAGRGHPVVAAEEKSVLTTVTCGVGEAQAGVGAQRRCSEGRIGVSQARAVAYVWVGVAGSAKPCAGQRGAGFYPEV